MTSTTVCHCPRCTIERAHVSGPFTPAQFAELGLQGRIVTPARDDPVSNDPAVKAAELEVKLAHEAFEPYDQAWREAVAAHQQAELAGRDQRPWQQRRGGMLTLNRGGRIAELAERVKQTHQDRDHAWQAVVRANDALRQAQQRVILALAQAGRPAD
jgi:hypothetical protein